MIFCDKNYAAIDIGNSRLKIKIGNDEFAIDHRIPVWQNKFFDLIDKHKEVKHWAISSVVSNIKRQVISTLSECGIEDTVFETDMLSVQSIVKYDHIQGIGNDRVFGLIAAMSFTSGPLITIDCGTAITINAIDAKGIVLGGAIFAGVHTHLHSLVDHTDQLMEIDLSEKVQTIGQNTEDSIRSGIIIGTVGAIRELIKLIKSNLQIDSVINILITGGSAELLFPYLNKSKNRVILYKTLVLDGILVALKEYLKKQ